MSYEMPALEDESFVPSEGDGNNEFAPAAEEGGLTNAAASTEGPQSNNGQQVERRNKRVSLYWKRPKSHLYEYNYDYGSNYYKGMVDYLDRRGNGFKNEPPPAQSWAERALRTYTEKREAKKQSGNPDPDVELLHKIRNNINLYTVHAKTYCRKLTGHYTY